MNKGHVTSLLADYLDGLLPPDEAAAVKKHLDGCAECRDEHRFLKAYMKETGAFPRVPVPDDFLKNIHARIDAPARGGLLRALFVPLKIKLPLEAAGALALTVLAVFIFKPFGERTLEYRSEAPVTGEQAAAPRQRADREIAAREKTAPKKERRTADEEFTAPGRITVANGAESAKVTPDDKDENAAVADMSLVLAAVRSESGSSGTRGASKSGSAPSDMIPSLQEKRSYDSRAGSVPSEYPQAEESASGSRSRRDVILGQATALGGRVLSAVDPVVVEIPAKNYARFIAGIRGSWSVRQQVPFSPPTHATKLRITLSLQD